MKQKIAASLIIALVLGVLIAPVFAQVPIYTRPQAASSGGGGGTPGGANTQVQFNSGGSFGGSANFTYVSPQLTIGAAGSTTGILGLTGSTSGTISILGQAAAGTYNFNLPTTAGSSGQLLTSAGGGASPMTWTSIPSLTGTPAASNFSYWTGASTQALLSGTGLIMMNAASAPTLIAPAAGQIFNGSTFTATPTLGSSGTLGTLAMGNATSGLVTLSPVTGALGTTTITIPAAVGTGRMTQTIASGAKALATASIPANSCATVQTDTATGTASTDTITFTPNASLTAVTGYTPAGTLTIVAYPTANTVNFDVCNKDGSNAVTPGAVTLNWRVTR